MVRCRENSRYARCCTPAVSGAAKLTHRITVGLKLGCEERFAPMRPGPARSLKVEVQLPARHARSDGLQAIADLVPRARNPRTHSPRQIEQIAASIRRFGFMN